MGTVIPFGVSQVSMILQRAAINAKSIQKRMVCNLGVRAKPLNSLWFFWLLSFFSAFCFLVVFMAQHIFMPQFDLCCNHACFFALLFLVKASSGHSSSSGLYRNTNSEDWSFLTMDHQWICHNSHKKFYFHCSVLESYHGNHIVKHHSQVPLTGIIKGCDWNLSWPAP